MNSTIPLEVFMANAAEIWRNETCMGCTTDEHKGNKAQLQGKRSIISTEE